MFWNLLMKKHLFLMNESRSPQREESMFENLRRFRSEEGKVLTM